MQLFSIRQDIRQAFLRLWQQAPLLRFALAISFGTLFALQMLSGLIAFCLLLLLIESRQIFHMTLLFIIPISYVHQPLGEIEGPGRFIIKSISRGERGYAHRGYWHFDERAKGRGYPCTIFDKKRLRSFSAKGVLSPQLQLKAEQRVTIARFSLLPLRERAKKSVRSYIHRRVENKGASSFLSALFTGDLEERLMRQEFCRLGLAHLLAISGFHFAIFVLFCRLLLSFLPLKPRIFALLLLVTTYFIFLGNSASVQRAFFFSIIALLSQLLERDGNALNTLGGALLIAVVTDPFSLKSLSLQLSFLATLGILLFYRPYREKLLEVVKLSPMKQLLAICRTLFLRACSLNLAVHLMIVPLLLYHFHTFSVHTLLYNLLFPFFVSISLLLLMAGFLLPFLHPLNSLYTSALLFAIENPPLLLPSIYFENFSIWAVVIPLLLLFVWGIVRQHAIEGT